MVFTSYSGGNTGWITYPHPGIPNAEGERGRHIHVSSPANLRNPNDNDNDNSDDTGVVSSTIDLSPAKLYFIVDNDIKPDTYTFVNSDDKPSSTYNSNHPF